MIKTLKIKRLKKKVRALKERIKEIEKKDAINCDNANNATCQEENEQLRLRIEEIEKALELAVNMIITRASEKLSDKEKYNLQQNIIVSLKHEAQDKLKEE